MEKIKQEDWAEVDDVAERSLITEDDVTNAYPLSSCPDGTSLQDLQKVVYYLTKHGKRHPTIAEVQRCLQMQKAKQNRNDGIVDQKRVQPNEMQEKPKRHQISRYVEQRNVASRDLTTKLQGTEGLTVEQKQREVEKAGANRKTTEIQSVLAQYSIAYLYHMTSIENLDDIITHGLLSHATAHKQKLIKTDISDGGVQQRREHKTIRCANGSSILLHDFVPFYVQPHNSMLYRVQVWEKRRNIILLCFDPHILVEKQHFVTDGNAASDVTRFTEGFTGFHNVNWQVLQAKYWTHNDPEVEKEQKRVFSSEVLIKDHVAVDQLVRVICYNQFEESSVRAIIRGRVNVPIEVRPSIYFWQP